MRPADTSPEAWAVFVEANRRMTPAEKLTSCFRLNDEVRRAAWEILRRKHPNASEQEILWRYARTTLGDELFRRAYGDVLPESEEPVPFDIERLQDEALARQIDRLVAQVRAE